MNNNEQLVTYEFRILIDEMEDAIHQAHPDDENKALYYREKMLDIIDYFNEFYEAGNLNAENWNKVREKIACWERNLRSEVE